MLKCWLTTCKRFGSHYDATVVDEKYSDYHSDELIHFAKAKLLDGPTELDQVDDTNELGSLACLAVRFALDFDLKDQSGREVALKQIECHM
jgi:hypothetical protein